MPRAKKSAAAAPAAIDPAMVAAFMAFMQTQGKAPAGAVATAVVEAPAKPYAEQGSFNADGWTGRSGELCVTVRRGKGKGITFLTQAQVEEMGSPVVSSLVARVEKIAGCKIGAKRK